MISLLPPLWLLEGAVAAVWLYEGLWCKLLGGDPNQVDIVETVPRFGKAIGKLFLTTLGVIEVALGIWVLTGALPVIAAIVQTALLVTLNSCGLIFSRRLIHDSPGMVVKNFAFLMLVWVVASAQAPT